MQPNMTWRESILRARALLSNGLSEVQAQVGVIIVVAVSDSEDNNNNNDNDKK